MKFLKLFKSKNTEEDEFDKLREFKLEILHKAVENNFLKIQERVDGIAFKKDDLFVIISLNKQLDNKYWVHISLSKKGKLPTYNNINMLKKVFIGEDKKAIQVFPEEEKHVNIHQYCLHLWHCIDGDSLPDFTQGSRSI